MRAAEVGARLLVAASWLVATVLAALVCAAALPVALPAMAVCRLRERRLGR